MQEMQVQSLGQEDPLEKRMATHSSILAWRIPWTEEPGRLQVDSVSLPHGPQESDLTCWLNKNKVLVAGVGMGRGFPGGTSGKEPASQCRRHERYRLNPWVRKTHQRRVQRPPHPQYSCLENPMDRGAWRATVHRVAKSQTLLKGLNMHLWYGQTWIGPEKFSFLL